MNKLKQWLSAHSKLTHSIVAGWGALTVLYATDPAFKAYILKLYGDTGPKMHEFIAGILIPLLLYWQSQKKSTSQGEDDPK